MSFTQSSTFEVISFTFNPCNTQLTIGIPVHLSPCTQPSPFSVFTFTFTPCNPLRSSVIPVRHMSFPQSFPFSVISFTFTRYNPCMLVAFHSSFDLSLNPHHFRDYHSISRLVTPCAKLAFPFIFCLLHSPPHSQASRSFHSLEPPTNSWHQRSSFVLSYTQTSHSLSLLVTPSVIVAFSFACCHFFKLSHSKVFIHSLSLRPMAY